MKDYILIRLKETSTWAGIITLLMAFHVLNLTPDQQSSIMLFIGAILAATPDRQHPTGLK